jgi:hypothetical protein
VGTQKPDQLKGPPESVEVEGHIAEVERKRLRRKGGFTVPVIAVHAFLQLPQDLKKYGLETGTLEGQRQILPAVLDFLVRLNPFYLLGLPLARGLALPSYAISLHLFAARADNVLCHFVLR